MVVPDNWPGGPIRPGHVVVIGGEMDLVDRLGLEVCGADGDMPTLMYRNKDGTTGLVRPALEPEVRMWKLLQEMNS